MIITLLEPALYKYLTTDKADLAALVGDNISKGKLEKGDLKGSGEAAIVFKVSGGEAPRGNSLAAPRVNIYIYADHTRVSGNVSAEDSADRMWTIFHTLDRYLHWPDREPRMIDDVSVIGSLRGVAAQILEDEAVGMPYLWTAYDMSLIYP